MDPVASDPERIVTTRTICALTVRDGASIGPPLIRIPPGAKVQVCGPLPDPRLIGVRWGAARYAVFEADLRES